MKTGEATRQLKQLISEKESEHIEEWKLLKSHLEVSFQELQPINLIRSSVKDAFNALDIKSDIVNPLIGLIIGVAVKKILIGKSSHTIIKLGGIVLELVIAKKVSNNAEEIKEIAGIVLKKIILQYSNPSKPV